MKLLSQLLSAAMACLLLCSCVVTSEQPWIDPHVGRTDPHLVGVWHTKEKSDEVITFSIISPHTMLVVDRQPGKPPVTHEFTVTAIKDESYMQFRDYDESTPGYTLVRYRMITGRGILTTWSMDSQKTAPFVQSGALRGKVIKNSGDDVDVKLTGDGAGLSQFLASHNSDAVFRDQGGTLFRLR